MGNENEVVKLGKIAIMFTLLVHSWFLGYIIVYGDTAKYNRVTKSLFLGPLL